MNGLVRWNIGILGLSFPLCNAQCCTIKELHKLVIRSMCSEIGGSDPTEPCEGPSRFFEEVADIGRRGGRGRGSLGRR